jgi:hypothetical protein
MLLVVVYTLHGKVTGNRSIESIQLFVRKPPEPWNDEDAEGDQQRDDDRES